MRSARSSRRVACLLIGATAILFAACAADERTTSPSTTEATPTTVPEPTTSTTAATTPSTTTPIDPHFEPECRERLGTESSLTFADDPALDTFGVVGSVPALAIELPTAITDSDPSEQAPIANAVRIPGGLLVSVSSPSTGWFPAGMVAAVDVDGTVRWVRCAQDAVAGVLVAPAATAPDRFLLGTFHYEDTGFRYRWEAFSLADGRSAGALGELVSVAGLADVAASNRDLLVADRGIAVFGPALDHVVDIDTDGLLRLDLATWGLSTTSFPPEFDDHPAGELQLQIGTDGSLLRMGQQLDTGLRVPQSVEVGGEWVTDPDLRRAVWGPTVDVQWNSDGTPVGSWDAAGAVLWTADVQLPGREGFMFGRSGDVLVAASCRPEESTGICQDDELVGLDVAAGRRVWSLPGWRIVGPMGDGIAYVTDSVELYGGETPSAWFVLDTATGVVADTPSWPGVDLFSTGCCGEGEYHHTTALGGIIVAVSGATMSVWLPAALTSADTVHVAIE